ncbi:Fat-like cadherin-related tumor suppressor -like protein [Halotydeus destructor]|nr:Fat-like cadherin-related tumor suppressor -like protein [Halotydeus destructor]
MHLKLLLCVTCITCWTRVSVLCSASDGGPRVSKEDIVLDPGDHVAHDDHHHVRSHTDTKDGLNDTNGKLDEEEEEELSANDLLSPSPTFYLATRVKVQRPKGEEAIFDQRYFFTKPFYNVSIPENAVGKAFATEIVPTSMGSASHYLDWSPYEKMGIQVSDPSLVVRFKIVAGDEHKLFKAEARHVGDFWFLRIRTRGSEIAVFNRERIDQYQLKVRAAINSVRDDRMRYKSRCDVFVQIEDSNDLNPLFYPTMYNVDISQDTPVGSEVMKVSAFDPDIGMNGEIYYSLDFTDETADFAIHPTTGVLSLLRPLKRTISDHDTPGPLRRQLTVWASDRSSLHKFGSSGHRHSAMSKATVNLIVVPPNSTKTRLNKKKIVATAKAERHASPKFKEGSYFANVREDFPIGALVMQMKAFDSRDGRSDRIKYFARSGNDEGRFVLDEDYGNVRIRKPLDYDKRHIYNLTIVARDREEPTLSAMAHLVIVVQDVDTNRFPPKFADVYATGSVLENQPRGQYVTTVMAVDEDKPLGLEQSVIYQIVDGSGLGRFSVDTEGRIHTRAVLDRESCSRYWLTIVARDKAPVPRASHVHVYIEVLDANDHAPLTTEPIYTVSVPENATISTAILQVNARDADSSSDDYQFNYRLLNDGVPFEIVKTTGLIRINGTLDREQQRQYVLDVEVSEVSSENGGHVLSSKSPVIVNLVDVNEFAPQLLHTRVRCQVYNSLPSAIPICHVIAFDEDDMANETMAKESPVYEVSEGNEYNFFTLDPHTGSVFFKGDSPIPKKTYELSVTVSDKGTPAKTSQALVIIKVSEPNEKVENMTNAVPKFIGESLSDTLFAVSENERIGHVITVFEVIDEDFDELTIHITAGNEEGLFAIYGGALLVARALDHEVSQRHLLTIAVTDGIDSSYCNITINVIDTNDKPPHFDKSVHLLHVAENVTLGSVILELRATDADSEQHLVYSMYSSASPRTAEVFEVEGTTGRIRVKQSLDRERIMKHTFVVEVSDASVANKRKARNPAHSVPSHEAIVHRAFTLVVVNIDDCNDNAPQFASSPYSAVIPETVALGASVVQVIATDDDFGLNAKISYSIVSGNVESTFGIEGDLGYIYLANPVNVRTQAEYYLIVKATDHGKPPRTNYSNVHLVISVADDAPPRFEKSTYSFEVPEDAKLGQIVASGIRATGKQSVVYDIVPEGDDRHYFEVNAYNGEVSLREKLDFEFKQRHDFKIKSTNLSGKNATCLVTVNVVDRNDNRPFWNESTFRGHMPESAQPGSIILGEDNLSLQIVAHDRDGRDKNGLVEYAINEDYARQLFAIDAVSGSLTLISKIDFEPYTEINFTVSVTDLGEPPLQALENATVIIIVDDLPDYPPLPVVFEKEEDSVESSGEKPETENVKSSAPVSETEMEARTNLSHHVNEILDSVARTDKNRDHSSEPNSFLNTFSSTATPPLGTTVSTVLTAATRHQHSISSTEQRTTENTKLENKLKFCSPINPCSHNGVCTELHMGYTCRCKPGFHGMNCERDIDECSVSPTVCPPHSTCINLPGNFHCVPHYHIQAGNESEYPCPGDHDFLIPTYRLSTPFVNVDFTADHVILLMLVLFILFLTCCCMSICWRCKSKSSRSRTPKNAYRSMTGNELLLQAAKSNELSINLKRFSKLSNLEPAAATAINLGQVHPQSRHVIRGRPMSVHEALNNFDTVVRYNSMNEGLEAAAQIVSLPARHEQPEPFIPNFKKMSPPIVVSVSPQLSEVVASQSTVSPQSSQHTTEDKIQNVSHEPKTSTASSSPSRSSPHKRNSMCDADMNVNEDQSNASTNAEGYHWDCSDWAMMEESTKPLANILEVSVAEVRDSECNSVDSQLDLVLANEQAAPVRKRSAPIRRKTFTISTHSASNGQNGHTPTVSPAEDEGSGGNLVNNQEDEASEASALLTLCDQVSELDYVDDSMPSSPAMYNSHPDDYLPVYRSVSDVNGSDGSFSANWKSSCDINHKVGHCDRTALTTDSSNDNVSSLPASSVHLNHSVKVTIDLDDAGYDGDHLISDTESVSGRQSTYV